LQLRVEYTFFVIYQKPGANPRRIGDSLAWVVR
jgi:hypothetical protein